MRLKSSRCGQKARCITVSGRRPIVPRDTLFNYGAKRCRAGRRRAIFSSPRRVSTRGRDRAALYRGHLRFLLLLRPGTDSNRMDTRWTKLGTIYRIYASFILEEFGNRGIWISKCYTSTFGDESLKA